MSGNVVKHAAVTPGALAGLTHPNHKANDVHLIVGLNDVIVEIGGIAVGDQHQNFGGIGSGPRSSALKEFSSETRAKPR